MTLVVIALSRQIGILHTRLAPAGALMNTAGPEVGTAAPRLSVSDLRGDTVTLGGPASQALLLLFISPTCPMCKELIPVALSLSRREKLRLDLCLATGENAQCHRRYIERMKLQDYPYVVSAEVGLRFAADKLPYCGAGRWRGYSALTGSGQQP